MDIRRSLKKFVPHFIEAKETSLNEADTVQRIIKCFEDVLGYDVLSDITREKFIKEKYVDMAIKIDGVVKFLVEAKAADETLRERHIEQAERYAAESNVRWVLLTNGVAWNLYHLTFEEGIEYEPVFAVDLEKDDVEKAAELLGLLHKQSLKANELEIYWKTRIALSPMSIGKALFTDNVLRLIRREIRKSEGFSIDEEDLANAIHDMFSVEARERIGQLHIRHKRKPKQEKPEQDSVPLVAAEPSVPAASPESQ